MEAIKNLLSGNKETEGQSAGTAANTNTSTHHKGGLTGEGSHFGSAKEPPIWSANQTTGGTNTNTADASTGHHTGATGLGGNQSSTTTAGPHSSNLANKADPTVDSDNSKLAGSSGNTSGLGGAGVTSGPHSSNFANKADPTVDSDNSKAAEGYSSTTGGSFHTGPSGSAVSSGPHETATANRLDPSVNTSTTGQEDGVHHDKNHGGGAERADNDHIPTSNMPGTFPSSTTNTTTPHKSDALNKIDPRVDATPTSSRGVDHSEGVLGGTGSSSLPVRTRDTNESHSSDIERKPIPQETESAGRDHNYGRDALLAGGAAGAAGSAYGAGGHGDESNRGAGSYPLNSGTQQPIGSTTTSSSGPHSSDFANKADPTVDSDNSKDNRHVTVAGAGHEPQTTGPHSSDLVNKADPTVDSDRSKETHYGRDAALAGGAGGLAYGASRDYGHDNSGTNLTNKAEPTVDNDQQARAAALMTGTAGGDSNVNKSHSNIQTAGPHSSNIANKADPTVDSDRSKESHHGRDAALIGGTGAGAYGASQLHQDKETAGPHSSDTANKVDPTVDSDRSKESHHRRDAALIGGTGAGAYGADKHHHDKETAGPHSSDTANKADPTVDSDRSKEKDHHYGRNAAVAGGLGGAAAYGAHEYNERDEEALKKSQKEQEHQLKEAEKERQHAQKEAQKQAEKDQKHAAHEAEKDQKHAQHEADKEHKKEVKAAEKQHEKDVKVAEKQHEKDVKVVEKQHEKDIKVAEKEQEKQRKEDEKHHEKAVLIAAKEHDKDAKQAEKDHEKEVKLAEKQHEKEEKKEKKHGFLSFLHRDKSKKYTKEEEDDFDRQEREHESNKGRNAALGGAAAGGAAYAAHKHNEEPTTTEGLNNSQATSHSGARTETDRTLVGDNTSTRHHDQPTSSTTTGHHDHHDQHEKPPGSTLGDKLHGVERNRGVQGDTGFLDDGNTRQHDGTAPGVGLGAGSGAGALGANEHRQHQVEAAAASQPGHTSSDKVHHDGSAPGVGLGASSGTGALGANEHQQYQGENTTASQLGQTSTGLNQEGNDAGRNRLHKDPPAGHPATGV